MISIATAQLWVHDQDEALEFYTDKVGMEVRSDVTVPEMGNFRWLTVGPPGQPDVAIVLMAIPGPPMIDAATDEQVRDLMGKGLAGTVFLTTDDCRRVHEEMNARGVEFVGEPRGAAVRHRRAASATRPATTCGSASSTPTSVADPQLHQPLRRGAEPHPLVEGAGLRHGVELHPGDAVVLGPGEQRLEQPRPMPQPRASAVTKSRLTWNQASAGRCALGSFCTRVPCSTPSGRPRASSATQVRRARSRSQASDRASRKPGGTAWPCSRSSWMCSAPTEKASDGRASRTVTASVSMPPAWPNQRDPAGNR